ncbi:hypothetical protein HG1285_01303 [Hydrogenivirga sp. 128-5-R1-1]|nr:hypothetical protein HG1285_01303 [Hydrogenivirga sp. 128-5-R1-1]
MQILSKLLKLLNTGNRKIWCFKRKFKISMENIKMQSIFKRWNRQTLKEKV